MKKQIYPLGEQSFKDIREEGKVYIDKTHFIPQLLEHKYYFLSRPRRFGKSLLLSTLENFFMGRRELFKGLAVEKFSWAWNAYPVIRINLAEGSFSRSDGLTRRLNELLRFIEEDHGLPSPETTDSRERFTHLIRNLSKKYEKRIVILIDEYEKPLLDSIREEHHEQYKTVLSEFYSVLKANEEKIQFIFITGVTRFGHLNIFSGFNNLIDISLDDEYSAICGITEEEMRNSLHSGIMQFAEAYNVDYDQAVEKLKHHYDGYHFSRKLIDIYNPFSLLNCLSASRLTDKWFQSGSSRFLLDQLKRNKFDIEELGHVTADESTLTGVDATLKDSVTLLYQSGYLTIKHYNPETNLYTLGLPNNEVSTALYSVIVPYYLGKDQNSSLKEAHGFIEKLKIGEINNAMLWLQGYFSSIPYDVKLNYEREFQQVIYAFFALTGQLSGATLEKQTSEGRIDMVYETDHYIYVFEFKLGKNPQEALDQINSKGYTLQWQTDHRKVFKIGVAFSSSSRGISAFKIEK